MCITVDDFLFLAIDDNYEVEIWSLEEEDTVFKGSVEDARYCEYCNCEIQPWSVEDNVLVLNID